MGPTQSFIRKWCWCWWGKQDLPDHHHLQKQQRGIGSQTPQIHILLHKFRKICWNPGLFALRSYASAPSPEPPAPSSGRAASQTLREETKTLFYSSISKGWGVPPMQGWTHGVWGDVQIKRGRPLITHGGFQGDHDWVHFTEVALSIHKFGEHYLIYWSGKFSYLQRVY